MALVSERVITLDREVLRLGKYTVGFDRLTNAQLHGLLWLLGEWATRAREDGSYQGSDERARAALEALRTFKSRPLTLEEAKDLIRRYACGHDAQ